MRTTILCAAIVTLGLVLGNSTVLAHHAFSSEFDANRHVVFTGTVTKMMWVNPHAWIYMDVKKPDGTTNYDTQANQNFAKNLKGKLLLTHGTMDDNVPPSNTMVLVDELIKANKDFDLLLLPNRRHGYAAEPYMMRRRWDYFVRNLLGAEPPQGYELRSQ